MAATHLDVGLRCIKYLLCAVNSLFVLTGVMIISVGTTIYALYDDFKDFLDPTYFSPATLLIVVGALVFLIAFFGCCGAVKESTCMVLVFAVSLSIVLVLEVAAAISAYALQDGIKNALADRINATMYKYGSNADATYAIDFLQSRLKCCGIYGEEDWSNVGHTTSNGYPFPESCCAWSRVIDISQTECGIYQDGCIGRMVMIVERSALNLGTGAIAIALIQFTGIMFACTLGRAIRRQKTERERRKWQLRQSLVDGYQPLGKNDPLTTFPVVYMQPSEPLKTSLVS
ncbi:CD63 antigen [Fopius arisanus]|uniref:Tetraspanin n=1 Tax=Fopius arisanus TaxID=64838 RepID=A0A9R1U3N0_9HYME|nr:PREDICTED: CD63 antigen [Fopius arisanus]